MTTAETTDLPCALLVDDDASILEMLAVYARVAGFKPLCARDGLQALGMLFGGLRPSVIVTDIDMPNLDGLELIERVRAGETLCSTPVIVYSGSPRPEDDGGADLWLEKSGPAVLVVALRGLAAYPPAPREPVRVPVRVGPMDLLA